LPRTGFAASVPLGRELDRFVYRNQTTELNVKMPPKPDNPPAKLPGLGEVLKN
jgi:hypothetical protein